MGEGKTRRAVIAIDDKRILLMLNNRDEQALAVIAEQYGALCRTVARDILGSEQDAEECLNDALLQIWNAIPPAQPEKHGTGGEITMKKEPKRDDDRFIIGLGGGHRIYDIINTRYVVEGRFAEATLTDDDRTLADAVEEIVKSEFTDLTPEDKTPKMKSKPVRSTAGKER